MRYVIDLHGLNVSESKVEIDNYLNSINERMVEIVVIHGYSSKILQHFVRVEYKHPRIKQKILTSNPGETILLLK